RHGAFQVREHVLDGLRLVLREVELEVLLDQRVPIRQRWERLTGGDLPLGVGLDELCGKLGCVYSRSLARPRPLVRAEGRQARRVVGSAGMAAQERELL